MEMAAIEITFPTGGQPGRILKWRIRLDTMVSVGRVLLLYQNAPTGNDDAKSAEKKLRATRFGRVTKLLVKEGDIVQPGEVIATLEGCRHPTVMKDLCAECGVDLRVEGIGNEGENTTVSQASVPMVHSIPELKVCPELAEKIGKEDEERLLGDKKLVLLVDLDQTIVHTTNDNVPPNMKDVYHYQLYGPNSPWYHTRLRPNTRHFLKAMSELYELHICTFGARNYAHTVAALLDKDGVLFSHRILSRDECFDPASKTANLKALFPCGDDLVCIIDDREDVWQGCGNLVQVKAYHYFRHTGDIHAPPGLEKNDDVPCLMDTVPTSESNVEISSDNNDKNGLIEPVANEVASDGIAKESKSKQSDESNSEAERKGEERSTKENSNKSAESRRESDDKTNDSEERKTVSKDASDAETAGVKMKQDAESSEFPITDEDDDDYLLYLEDILRRIHAEFYIDIDKQVGRVSLRDIIPRVRAQVLKGLYLTFSGLIPTHQKLHQSRAYRVARAFGAEVTQDLVDKTTHLVAIKPGTAKANAAKRNENIKIVNPDWLWTCAERWEHVDERLFPLTAKARASRIPPPHCSSPDRVEEQESGNCFADSINPLMSFTQEEIDIMDKEVDEDMEDQDMEAPVFDSEDMSGVDECGKRMREDFDSDNSGNEDETGSCTKKRKVSPDSDEDDFLGGKEEEDADDDDDNDNDNDDEDDDDDDDDEDLDPVTRFRRGEDLPDDLDLGDNSQGSIDDLENNDNEDDREWNAMGAALEREFLSD